MHFKEINQDSLNSTKLLGKTYNQEIVNVEEDIAVLQDLDTQFLQDPLSASVSEALNVGLELLA